MTVTSSITQMQVGAVWSEVKTFTNVGTSFTDVYVAATNLNSERKTVDFSGYRQYRMVGRWQNVGGSITTVQLVDTTSGSNVLGPIADAGTAAEKEIDGGWTSLPSWATGEKLVKPQMKAATSTDDPVFRLLTLYLR